MAQGITVVFGRVAKMQALVSYLNGLTLRLYKNAGYTPAVTDTASAVTESTFPGYAPVPLTTWGTAFLNSLNQGESDELLRIFTCSGGGASESVYGYYITDGTGNLVMVQAGSSGGVVMVNSGDSYAVVPKDVIGTLTYP